MKLHKLYDYPTSSRALYSGERMYDVGSERLPSVTTILSATQPPEKQAALAAWKARVGEEQATRTRDQSANRGTAVHTIIEGYLKNENHLDLTDLGQQAHPMAQKIINNCIKDRVTEILGIEPTLFHAGMRYAGATDLICIHEGVPTICDWKQSNRPKRREWLLDSYLLQIAAYSLAFQDMFGDIIHKGINAVCTPDLYYQEFVWEGEEFKQAKYEWMRRVEQYYNQKEKGLIDKTK